MQQYWLVSHEYLRTAVLHSTTECREESAGLEKGCWSEIDELDMEVLIEDDVLILDVPMYNWQIVQVTNGRYNLQIHL